MESAAPTARSAQVSPTAFTSLRRGEGQAAADALALSEARYRLLAETATDIVACYGADAKLTYISPSVREVLGYEPEVLIGKSLVAHTHPDDVEPARRLVREHLKAGPSAAPIDFEYRAFRSDGRMVWLSAHSKAVYDPVTGDFVEYRDSLRDITASKAVEAELAASEARYRVIFEMAKDILSRTAINGRFTYVSPSLADVTGYTAEELKGRSLLPFIHPEDVEASLAFYRRILAGERLDKTPLRHRVRHKQGHWIWLESNPTLVRDAAGEPLEFVDIARDVTKTVSLEAQLREAKDDAQAAAGVKADFMANMSHEIRQPVMAILGFAELLERRTDLADARRTLVDRIEAASQSLLAIVNDVLDFSKLEAGQVEIEPTPTVLPDLFADTLSMFSTQAEAKGLALRVSIEGEPPPALMVDPHRTRQVLSNLIGNALKFTEHGVVGLVARYDRSAQRLEVRVADTGPGMTKAQQTKLFRRFSQVDASTVQAHGGTGLGLAICKGLVEAMGGDIGVRSKLGKGSVFTFRIPAPVAGP